MSEEKLNLILEFWRKKDNRKYYRVVINFDKKYRRGDSYYIFEEGSYHNEYYNFSKIISYKHLIVKNKIYYSEGGLIRINFIKYDLDDFCIKKNNKIYIRLHRRYFLLLNETTIKKIFNNKLFIFG